MKKVTLIILLQVLALAVIFGAAMDAREGYDDLPWGSSVSDATKKGFKLTPMTSADDKAFLGRLYTVPVDGYTVKSKDKMVLDLQFHYYMGRLFAVSELINLNELNQKKLESRYGKFSDREIFFINGTYMDAKLGDNGKISRSSISISKTGDYVLASLRDWEVYKEISIVGKSLEGNADNKSSSIVEEFSTIASKLLQENASGTKASYAFLPLATDYNNTLVDNYVTDALTEAVFNTGSARIIERSNLEAILSEQKFQASGLVNEETAKSIGMLAGVDYVCYGTLKDIGDAFTVNVRVVDVETGEICAITRGNITKDEYLQNQSQSSVGKSSSSSAPTTKRGSSSMVDNLWQVSSYRNEFDGFTSYTFFVRAGTGEMIIVEYRQNDLQHNSRVMAGICWFPSYGASYQEGKYDFRLEDGTVVSKSLYGNWTNYLDLSKSNYYGVAWIENAGARWLLEILIQNDMLTLRKNNVVRRFQTAGLLDKMAEYGITWDEIDAAMANEEF